MLDELRALDLRVPDKLDRQLLALCRTNEACRRLSKLPGVGPVIATAIVAAVDDGRHFHSGRELAAWIGLVPRQYTTGGKPRLGGIGRRANHYLRRQMIHGARAVMFRLAKREDRRSQRHAVDEPAPFERLPATRRIWQWTRGAGLCGRPR